MTLVFERATVCQMRIPRWVVFGAVALAMIALVAGVSVDAKGFAVNLFAGLVVLAISVMGVDHYLKRRRKEQWARTQAFTLKALAVHLGEITGSLFQHYKLPSDLVTFFGVHSNPLDPAILAAFGPALDLLRQTPDASVEGKSPSDAAATYYHSLEWDFAEIANILTPRVTENPVANQDLIDRLVEFDGARRTLRHAIIAHEQAVTQSVYPSIIALIEAAQRLYAQLLVDSASTPSR